MRRPTPRQWLVRFVPVVSVLMVAVLVSAGCSTMQVSWDYDTAADFSTLETYAWLDEEPQGADPRTRNALLAERVRNAVDAQLAAKGYKRLVSGSPDFLVAWYSTIDQKMSVETIDYGRGYYWGPSHAAETRVHQYEQGTLIVDILKPGKPQLIWRSAASARLRQSLTPEERTEQVQEAARRMFEAFPPAPKR